MRLPLGLFAAAAVLTLAACGESPLSPVRPARTAPRLDVECRSGYHIATRDDGSTYCDPDGFGVMSAGTDSTLSAP